MKISTSSLTLIASAFLGANKATATSYTLVGNLKGGFCQDSQGNDYTAIESPYYGKGGSVSDPCIALDDATALNVCETYCSVGCWGCMCIFDDPSGATISNATLQLYTPPALEAKTHAGTGPVAKSGAPAGLCPPCNVPREYTCYKYTAPPPTPAPTTSAPTRKPIATTSAPTRKPTAAGSKSSKGVKATKGPSAKSSKNAKRG
eukprot:scaffold17477_cov41-Cyclotella_meneghiniana.AAC.2